MDPAPEAGTGEPKSAIGRLGMSHSTPYERGVGQSWPASLSAGSGGSFSRHGLGGTVWDALEVRVARWSASIGGAVRELMLQ